MAMKTPVTGSTLSAPLLTSRSFRPSTFRSPKTSATTECQANLTFGLARARSCMIFDARKSPRRCTTVTDSANRLRNTASSRAESPPPITAMCWPRKKNPSQVAQVETPWPSSSRSLGKPSMSERAPVATMTALAPTSSSSPLEGSRNQTV